MAALQASRTLVKSTPELWAECSDAVSLARHLGAFGEIRITKLEPETAVAWEGDDVCGTVTLEPSAWGTRVILTASVARADPDARIDPVPRADPDPAPARDAVPEERETAGSEGVDQVEVEVEVPPPVGFLRRILWGRRRRRRRRRGAEPAGEQPAVEGSSSPVSGTEPAPLPQRRQRPPALSAEPIRAELPGAALEAALHSLGRAHHRPFSRA